MPTNDNCSCDSGEYCDVTTQKCTQLSPDIEGTEGIYLSLVNAASKTKASRSVSAGTPTEQAKWHMCLANGLLSDKGCYILPADLIYPSGDDKSILLPDDTTLNTLCKKNSPQQGIDWDHVTSQCVKSCFPGTAGGSCDGGFDFAVAGGGRSPLPSYAPNDATAQVEKANYPVECKCGTNPPKPPGPKPNPPNGGGDKKKGGLSGVEIAVIVVGAVGFLALLGFVIYSLLRTPKK